MLEHKDSLWIDTTDSSPYPLRKNGYTVINKGDKEEKGIKKKLETFDTDKEED
jgi:hypothetical protein